MIKILVLSFALFLPCICFSAPSSAGVAAVECPAGIPVSVEFTYSNNRDFIVSSNTVSVMLPDTNNNFSKYILPAVSDVSGQVLISYSSGALSNLSCSSSDTDMTALYLRMYSFAFGVVVALSFIGGIKSNEK